MAEPLLDLTTALQTVSALRGRRVLVLGDVMLDRYWWGTVSRISPEAPVPVVLKQRETRAPGGAANVAANIASLGGTPLLVGVVGDDAAGCELRTVLEERGISPEHLLVAPERPTTVKTRIVAHNQHVVRVDEEITTPLAENLTQQVARRVTALLGQAGVLILSDYAKGLLTPGLLREIIPTARSEQCLVLVDPKGRNYSRYNGATVVTPNRLEAAAAAGLEADGQDAVELSGRKLLEMLDVAAVLITQGEAGMTLFERERPPLYLPALARTVYDVTGAGDTVVATLGLAMAAGASLPTAAQLANLAAGLAVERVGTTAVTWEQLRRAVQDGRYRNEVHGAPEQGPGVVRDVRSVPWA